MMAASMATVHGRPADDSADNPPDKPSENLPAKLRKKLPDKPIKNSPDKSSEIPQSVDAQWAVSRTFILGFLIFHPRNTITDFYYIGVHHTMCKELPFLKLRKL